MLGLRLSDGVDLDVVEHLRGPSTRKAARQRTIERLLTDGKLKRVGNALQLPPEHWIVADSVIRQLL